ncbi:Spy/CpxP family protein refolding chaperone [Leptothoe sp. PORK10 BA2]|uniref:Spy/CpxP family protein refolding chaperone n=1 Tax=Leptothoe sp. PORK10 BA2 TaxID=3110254 RepID=UPI002B205449|nr:Spy/CpxP family protein refolding chaperone [Leptothoe sp. PORK10 BA2]MEA5462401.1 Spy/CpxP family protein refolding chaperone [Leptothoe sp. PORK10 BA2]
MRFLTMHSTIKQFLGGALMLTTLLAAPAMFKVFSASALPPDVAEELNLTPAQQAELEAIKENAHNQIEAILTADQLAALEGTTGRERHQAMRDLDLSEAQRTQLREIRESSRAAAGEVFTAEQRSELEAMRAERGEGRKDHRKGMGEALNLTPEQQSELEAIKQNAQSQVEAVLTADQLASLEGTTGRERHRAIRNLNLSEEQRTQMQAIRESSRAAADQVLTDEQRAQREEMGENRGQRRQR